MRNEKTPKLDPEKYKKGIKTYLFIKLFSAFITVVIIAGLIGILMFIFSGEFLSEFVLSVGLVTFIIIVLVGIPISILLDLISKSDKGVSFIVKTFLHGAAGIILAILIFTESLVFFGSLNSIIYYFVYVFIKNRFTDKWRNRPV